MKLDPDVLITGTRLFQDEPDADHRSFTEYVVVGWLEMAFEGVHGLCVTIPPDAPACVLDQYPAGSYVPVTGTSAVRLWHDRKGALITYQIGSTPEPFRAWTASKGIRTAALGVWTQEHQEMVDRHASSSVDELLAARKWRDRVAALAHPDVSSEVVDTLTRDPAKRVRLMAAKHPLATSAALLAMTDGSKIHARAMRRSDIDEALLRSYMFDGANLVACRGAAADRRTPSRTLRIMFDNMALRYDVLRNPSVEIELVDQAMFDERASIQILAAMAKIATDVHVDAMLRAHGSECIDDYYSKQKFDRFHPWVKAGWYMTPLRELVEARRIKLGDRVIPIGSVASIVLLAELELAPNEAWWKSLD